jgi:hypothetical protein
MLSEKDRFDSTGSSIQPFCCFLLSLCFVVVLTLPAHAQVNIDTDRNNTIKLGTDMVPPGTDDGPGTATIFSGVTVHTVDYSVWVSDLDAPSPFWTVNNYGNLISDNNDSILVQSTKVAPKAYISCLTIMAVWDQSKIGES